MRRQSVDLEQGYFKHPFENSKEKSIPRKCERNNYSKVIVKKVEQSRLSSREKFRLLLFPFFSFVQSPLPTPCSDSPSSVSYLPVFGFCLLPIPNFAHFFTSFLLLTFSPSISCLLSVPPASLCSLTSHHGIDAVLNGRVGWGGGRASF